MKRYVVPFGLLLLFALTACDPGVGSTGAAEEAALAARTANRHGGGQGVPAAAAENPAIPSRGVLNFAAPLDAEQEVADPPVESDATGVATFQYRAGSGEIHYRLIVANIENVRMAHIHVAPAGVNGPVVVWLYPDAPPPQVIPGRTDGILATGVITADSLVGMLAGAEISDLLELMIAGETYVNVHTDQYPPGEIRGQIDRGNGVAR